MPNGLDGSEPVREEMTASTLATALVKVPFSLVLTNPRLDDNPLVYVNRAFEEMTGYSAASVIGRNCRFLQADDRDQDGIGEVATAVAEGREVTVDLRNYRADGSQFRNRLMVSPIFQAEGDEKPAYFLGVQTLATDDAAPFEQALSEIQHRVKNHLSMIVGMIRLQARDAEFDASKDFKTLARRVEALQLLYEEITGSPEGDNRRGEDIALGAYLSRVSNAIAHIDGRSGIRINIDADAMMVPLDTATQLGLLLSEVMTNALQHAFDDRTEGLVEVRIKQLGNKVMRVQVSDDGVGMPDGTEWPSRGSLGGRIVRQLVRGLDAKLSVDRALNGTVITVDIPQSGSRMD